MVAGCTILLHSREMGGMATSGASQKRLQKHHTGCFFSVRWEQSWTPKFRPHRSLLQIVTGSEHFRHFLVQCQSLRFCSKQVKGECFHLIFFPQAEPEAARLLFPGRSTVTHSVGLGSSVSVGRSVGLVGRTTVGDCHCNFNQQY